VTVGDPSEAVTRVNTGPDVAPEATPTLVDAPRLQPGIAPAAGQARQKSLATETAQTVMTVEDRDRARRFALFLAGVGLVGALDEALVYRTGSATLRTISIAMLAGVAAAGVLVYWIGGRASERARVRMVLAFVVYLVATGVVMALHLGVMSAFQAAVVLAMFVFGLDGRMRLVVPFAVLACLANAIPAMLVATRVIDDPGVFNAPYATNGERLSATIGTLTIYAAAFVLARSIRRSMQAAVERASEAALRAQRHEALLAEANRNLDAVARADAHRGGPYTGRVVGDFRLGGIIGRGGMGEVYVAERTADARAAAVKLLTQQGLRDSAAVARFVREVEMARRIRVPNVVEVLAAGEGPAGEPYLAMELLVGHDLSWHLRRRASLPLEEVVALVEHVAAGLHAAHAAGVVHRDLKPQNLFLHQPGIADAEITSVGGGTWKILDFGVGKLQGSGATLTGFAVVGTPGYMAPEQVHGGEIDARTDVFALGAVAYRALTGRPPFGVAEVQAMFDVVSKQPLAPSTLERGVPTDVDHALAIALAKEPRDRFATAPELAQALRAASRGDLAPSQRARSLTILRARPWGSVIRDPR
jgi:eukaryotic-like serine/threonine-protein kinase